jgi:threonine-phosphate decarboxylase
VDRFIAASQAFLMEQREMFKARVESVPDLTCFPSTTSYLLIRLPPGLTAPAVCRRLAAERILIRDCSNFNGLSDRYVRVSLKGRECNQKVAGKLAAMCG